MRSRWIALLTLALSVIPAVVVGHGVGTSFERQTDEFLVDIGFDRPFQVGEETLIDFSLFSVKNGKAEDLASFTKLTYSIHSGSSVLATRSIVKPEFGKVFETLTPDKRGNWVLTIDFISDDESIFSSSFDMEIIPSAKAQAGTSSSVSLFVIIIACISAAAFFIFRRSTRL